MRRLQGGVQADRVRRRLQPGHLAVRGVLGMTLKKDGPGHHGMVALWVSRGSWGQGKKKLYTQCSGWVGYSMQASGLILI